MKTKQQVPSSRATPVLLIVALLWFMSIVAVMAWIGIYSNSPSAPGHAPAQWPELSQIPRQSDRPTLLMFVHPHCPCSRSSLGERGGALSVHIEGVGKCDTFTLKLPAAAAVSEKAA